VRQPARHFVFDFDSTLVQVESLPELARISLRHHPERAERFREVERITELTASGKMSMAEGIALRIELASAHRKHVDSLIRVLRRSLTPSIKRNRLFFKNYRSQIFVLSNGFQEFIGPVLETLGLNPHHLFANTLIFDDRGYVIGFDSRNPLVHQDGKARVLKSLQLVGECLVIGDGFSDVQIKEAGLATRFYAFTENVRRECIVELADHVLPSLDELLYLLALPIPGSYPRSRMRVLLLEGIHPAAVEYLRKEGYTVRALAASLDEEALIRELPGITLLGIRSRTRITRRILESASELKAIGAFCIGTNQVDLDACSDHGVKLLWKRQLPWCPTSGSPASSSFYTHSRQRARSPGGDKRRDGGTRNQHSRPISQNQRADRLRDHRCEQEGLSRKYQPNVVEELARVPHTIKFRVLY